MNPQQTLQVNAVLGKRRTACYQSAAHHTARILECLVELVMRPFPEEGIEIEEVGAV